MYNEAEWPEMYDDLEPNEDALLEARYGPAQERCLLCGEVLPSDSDTVVCPGGCDGQAQ